MRTHNSKKLQDLIIILSFLLQDNPRMAKFTIEDSLKKHDADKDGQISKKEFLGEKIIVNFEMRD